jgi:O-antigen/teichoic acid export membrane protein
MRRLPRLMTSSALLSLGVIGGAGLSFLFQLAAARGLGPRGYGAFTASLSFVTLWAIVMEGGIGLALTREASADPARLAWALRLALWKLGLALFGIAGAIVSAWLLRFDASVVGLVGILAVGMAGVSAMRLAFAVFRAIGRFGWEAVLSAAQKLILILLAAAVLAFGADAAGIGVAFTTSYLVGGLAALTIARRLGGPAFDSSASAERPPAGFFAWTCLPLLAVELFSGIYFKVDQVVLLRLRGLEETGLYAAAFRVIEMLLLLLGGTMTVLFPRLAGSAREAPDAFRRDFVRAWRTLVVIGVVIAVNGWLWAVRLLPVVFGSAYGPSQAILHILLGAVPFIYVNALLSAALIATGHERFYAGATALGALANLSLNLLLVPRSGATAAAWVAVGTAGLLLLVCLLGLRDHGPIVPLASTLAIAAGGVLATVFGAWMIGDRLLGRGVFALAASTVLWEAAAPWPLRTLLGARALTGAENEP